MKSTDECKGSGRLSLPWKKRRSKEGIERHRQKYLGIMKRHKELEKATHGPPVHFGDETVSSIASRTKICKYYYRTGSCCHGSDCNFSHDCIPINQKELKLCRFYLKGDSGCRHSAEDCKYSHEPSLFLCRQNVINGACINGPDNCMFKHLDMDDISSMDDAEKLRFCYNNKQFLTKLLARYIENLPDGFEPNVSINILLPKLLSLDDSHVERLPWYLRVVYTLLIRDHEQSDFG